MADDRGRSGQHGSVDAYGRPLAGWVRYAGYEVRNGVIRSAAGARPEAYDPWEEYRAARSGWGGRGGAAPYESLLELVWSIRLVPGLPGEPARLEPASEKAVVDWCAAHGLLGLVSHGTEVAYLAPRWAVHPDFEAVGIPLVPVRRNYRWGAWGWQSADEVGWGIPTLAREAAPKQEGELVPRDLWPEHWGTPFALGRTLDAGSWVEVPLDPAWARYFPDVPTDRRETYRYPQPLTDEFWAEYGEPVDMFLSGAKLFAETLPGLDRAWRAGETLADFARRRAAADRGFFHLTAGVQPAFGIGPDGGPIRAWRARSLLASYAMMAYLDLTSGRRILACEVCGKPFVTAAYQARYCSTRCRNTAMKRAYRDRRRVAGATGRGIPREIDHDDESTTTVNPHGQTSR